jgi:predicted RNA binding protein YcfA (HicA-like mRNA interferase family)
MPKLQPLPWKAFEKFLLQVGCVFKRQEASHRVYWKKGLNRPIIIQAKGNVPVFIILNNLRTLGIERNEYLEIINKL